MSLGATDTQRKVMEILHSTGKVNGVRLADGTTLKAKYMVNSAGAWGTELARTAGIELTIEPVKRQHRAGIWLSFENQKRPG